MSNNLSSVPIATLIMQCRQERQTFFRNGTPESPTCLELFRRAFDGDQAAWESIVDGFQPQLIRWVRSWDKLLTLLDPEDLAQDALLKFYRWAPQRPHLLATQSLGPVVRYLQLCLKSAALESERKFKDLTAHIDLDEQHSLTIPTDWMERVMLENALHPFIAQWAVTEQEQVVFVLYFVHNYKPQEIFEDQQQLFGTYEEVAKILQRMIRRMRRDAPDVAVALHAAAVADSPSATASSAVSSGTARQKPTTFAFLPVNPSDLRANSSTQNETTAKDSNVDTPCPYDEIILLEYLMGRVDTATVAAIEQSPICRQNAATLAAELEPLLQRLAYRQCPSPLTLLEYQERLLTGTEQLIVHRHVETCPLCQAELALSTAMDEAARPLETGINPVTAMRRIVEAVFQSPLALAQPVRGELGSYRTANVTIRLTTRLNAGKARTWSLRGQVRNAAGELIMNEIEEVRLQRIVTEEHLSGEGKELTTSITPGATSFVYKELLTGDYSLRVMTMNEEIIIRRITIGIDD